MAFLSPLFLVGALAAIVPVLVHLVRRTQAVRVPFASLMFLRRIEQKTIRKRRLRNLALLAMRCAALFLLALAFARPYFTSQSAAASGDEKPRSVILIDASYSMRYGDVFNRARQAARDIVGSAPADEQIAIVLFGQSYEILRPLKADRAEAFAILDQMQPGLEATDYLQALQAADAILKDAGRGPRRIYLVSDFQEPGWNRSAPPAKLSPGTELIPTDVSEATPSNLAVTEVKSEPVVYSQKYAGKVVVRVGSFNFEPEGDVAIEFKLNDLAVERRQVNLAGSSQIIEFSGFNVPEGSNRATVEITGDRFTLDNRFYFTIRREDQTKVLAIETAVRGRSGTYFLQQSLMAGENNRYVLTVKTPGTLNPQEIDSYRVVIVNDAAGISDHLASALKGYVEHGGGLILAAGKHTELGDFNRAFKAISPAELGETIRAPGYALMSQIKTDHPIFGLFRKSGRLTSTRVYAYHRAVPRDGALTVAALDDGSPVIVEASAGRGKVLLVTTTLDTAWNDLPLTPMFLPLVRQMLEYLGGGENTTAYTIGQVFAVPPDAEGRLPMVENPSGGRFEEMRKNPSGEIAVSASEVGFYRLRYGNRSEHVAVNLDTKESDLAKLDLKEFIASILPEGAEQNTRTAPAERLTAEEIEAGQRLWLPLLIAALALFVAEALIARRIRIAKLVG